MKPDFEQPEHEHEFEAAPGLPEPLPAGERLLWQGAPDWRRLAVHAFHVRKLALYFALLLALHATGSIADGRSPADTLAAMLVVLPLPLLAIAIALGLAWLSARTTLYTLTDRRVVLRVGIVLSLTFNLPYRCIESAGLRSLAGGHGDIPLVLKAPDRIAWLHLWPHARPWQLARPQPMLRCVAEASQVARLLSQAWAASNGLASAPSGAEAPASAIPARTAHPALATP
ncbi:photosynthetic complex putative assembly protein PuhB [Rivibacter subsaxonicus]|uniref:PH (Pleckstrin Homology) domain-containing protein n=1 Tax=Rivibacter subsaxonicus TaxID=457575 RepID=A0A4Q7W2J0_9BURK|nr:photosynthetic complex putative assembly protein PuhB [Rivibacter subsaxonicus]RZU02869.1 PH (Pleckstrin Homology) domain-containing protein [Rivibacter subsaxonicus]